MTHTVRRQLHHALNFLLFLSIASAACAAAEAPKFVEKDGRWALMVDGQPYLMLGGQVHNSSAWPSELPRVWKALGELHANTVEAPVYWEQIEPQQGKFNWENVDLLVKGAREHNLHVVLLWFGTWKNGNMHYVPQWVKIDTKRFPRVIRADGEPIDVLSASSRSNLDADKTAFTALMRHLKSLDGTEHTVLVVQVENESGIIGSSRDFSAESNKEFAGQVPADMQASAAALASAVWPFLVEAEDKASRIPIAFSTLGCPAWEWKKILDFAQQHGFSAIELRGLQGSMDLPANPIFAADRIEQTKKEIMKSMISRSFGEEFFLSRAAADIIIPDVQ